MTAAEIEAFRVAAQTAAGEVLRVSTMRQADVFTLTEVVNTYRRYLDRYHHAMNPNAIAGTPASRIAVELTAVAP